MNALTTLFDPCHLACPRQRARNRELRAEGDKLLAPIDALGLSTRANNVLLQIGCRLVGQVIARGRNGVSDAKGAGPIIADEIHAAVERFGLTLPFRGLGYVSFPSAGEDDACHKISDAVQASTTSAGRGEGEHLASNPSSPGVSHGRPTLNTDEPPTAHGSPFTAHQP